MNPRLKSLTILGGALLVLGVASSLTYFPLVELFAAPGDDAGLLLTEAFSLFGQAATALGAVLLGGGIVAHIATESLAVRLGRPGAAQTPHGRRHPHDPYGADWDPDS